MRKWLWPNLVLFHSALIPPSSCLCICLSLHVTHHSPYLTAYHLTFCHSLRESGEAITAMANGFSGDIWWHSRKCIYQCTTVHLREWNPFVLPRWPVAPLPLSRSLSLWMPSVQGNGKVLRSFVATLKCHAEEKIFNGLSVAFPALTCQVIRNISPSHTHSRSVSLVNHLFFIPPLPRAITPC